ncbi:MAG: bifunctional 2-C-methyl-D-erythritol 4-phosphate cytidylyltransferase/2-C-methyl-D-erythritol 2,4-cyclodiphosphate synthase [Sphingomonadaceae bacterium]
MSEVPSPLADRSVAAIVVAAGTGTRAGKDLPKQYVRWRGKPVLRHSVERLLDAGCAPVMVAIAPGSDELAAEAVGDLEGVAFCTGGETRQQSVANALERLAGAAPSIILIHDAARPIVPNAVVERLVDALSGSPGAIPTLPVVDSLAVARDGLMGDKADRDTLRRVQTPQAFRFPEILAAHRDWGGTPDAGDDAQVLRAHGGKIALVEGDEALKKLTFAEDFELDRPAIRTGMGFDVHRLAEGESLWLGGLQIEHTHGLAGHSDADVALHAITDAVLGAIGAGDIGDHFPPSDPQWKGASSDQFLAHAVTRANEAGYTIGNIDLTIICEAPKIGPHRAAMRDRIAQILGVETSAIGVKATTTEGLGLTGRREGIAAQAVATLAAIG